MKKIIEFLIYTFTNRLEKILLIQFTNGIPTPLEAQELTNEIEKKFKVKSFIQFNDLNIGVTIDEIYIKKS